jgi:glycosyltransferase involved in cell wall biosynthesis
LLDDPGLAAFDLLSAAPHAVIHGPKVSVIISTHNSSGRLTAALRSLQNQTWRNCEFIIVDDASPGFDDKDIAETFARDDNRFIYMRMPYNGGAYVARNEALKHVSGEFVTLHDSDDWSHPQKIETQARFMLSNPSVIGCTSEQIRCTSDLVFDEIRSNEYLVFFNTSSFLWRRSVVIKALGCWDAVRFGADSEFIRRVQSVFGINSVVHMNTGPLSFQRRHNSSVTSGELTGLETLYSGARKEYAESSAYYLLNYHIPHYSDDISVCRQFPVPTMMLPSHGLDSGNLAFDIVIYGDVYQGSEYMENVLGIIMDDKLANYTMALIPVVSDGRVPPSIEIVADVRRLSHLGYVFIAVYGERVLASRIVYASPLPQELLFVADVLKG